MPIQFKNSFDPATLGKIKRSAIISAGGFLVAVLPVLLPDVLEMVKDYPHVAVFLGAAGPWLVNSIREYLKGQE